MPKHFHFGQTVQLISSQDFTSYLGMGSHAWPIRNLSIPKEEGQGNLMKIFTSWNTKTLTWKKTLNLEKIKEILCKFPFYGTRKST